MIRRALRALRNVRRRLRRAPEFVLFTLAEEYTDLPPRGNFIQRRLAKQPNLRELAEQLRQVGADPRVRGVVVHLRQTKMQMAQLETIRDMLHELRESGKRVVAWATSYNTGSYYLATAADEILIQHGGTLSPLGLMRGGVFLADALARIGLQADFVQISPYKSAPDMLMRRDMSPEVREMQSWLIDGAFDEVVGAIARGRVMSTDEARRLVDSSPYLDRQAVEARAVDAIVSEEDIAARLGAPGEAARVLVWDKARKRLRLPPLPRGGKHVVLVRVEGNIVDGESQRPPFKIPGDLPFLGERAGDLSVVREVRKATESKRAAAVVLWVDSGGGSASSSEAMSAALDRLAERKPLVASMGWVAGSGGYYVTTPARWVFAQPSTITGSIGVLSGKIVNEDMLGKLLINREVISRGERATLEASMRAFTDEERKLQWEFISRIYEVFLERVSAARKMSVGEVDAVGGGRVWTGRQALDHGLVDELGSVERAIAKAKELAGLHPEAKVREVRVGKVPSAPVPSAAAAVSYALEGAGYFDGRALCLTPLI